MNEGKFKVLLYFDDSLPGFFAAVHTAAILKNMPNMHLTVVQVQEGCEDSAITEFTWLDTKDLVNWAIARSSGKGAEGYWPLSTESEWLKRVSERSHTSLKNEYCEILARTNEIFRERAHDVSHLVIYGNPGISNTLEALNQYAAKHAYNLIIMGTRGFNTLKVLFFGCLAGCSPVPMTLVRKLPQGLMKH
ncbi:universal stress protein UspA-like protein [Desulfosporosinus orientis DSM 765]|uniref:Universal stress protein UspA-like protein n=1 Tax=Desulfosporosinus orientis (strain ATCC 19365 / DSM 765 / NCIMB 8382 / VKM B-1628 / Singapore I) TaxID=768706 RepID=G7W611_DESOD|nr:universal stress protein [Desulfosporosinus orientis]AET67387.1 universal stress protein UspA-like protein [Desulfosporosinus orientis DSM 765]